MRGKSCSVLRESEHKDTELLISLYAGLAGAWGGRVGFCSPQIS